MPSVTRILIADDDALARRALVSYFEVSPDLEVVAVASDGLEAVRLMTAEIDVVVMDVRMPTMDGLEATRAIRGLFPDARILMLTSFDDDAAFRQALHAGAHGFLLKNSTPQAITDAVRATRNDVGQVSPAMLQRLAGPPIVIPDLPELTEREQDVLRHLCCGLSNAEITAKMHLSNTTVKGHISTLGLKLGAASRLQIVLRAHDLGLDRFS